MPPNIAADPKDESGCMLQIGKYNNVAAWNLEMRDSVEVLYGDGARFRLQTKNTYRVFQERKCILLAKGTHLRWKCPQIL